MLPRSLTKGETMTDSANDPKLAKADAQAAKARAKALRPWFKKKRFIVPIGLVVLIGLGQAVGGGGGSSSDNSATDTSSSDSAATEETTDGRPGIGQSAVDGAFSFTVKTVECGIESVGNDTFGEEAQGQFCLISLSIENIGDEAQTMFADNQKLFDTEGREFSADTGSMIYLENGADAWLSEINPGNTLEGQILFDIPKDATLDYITLSESLFSGGVEVSLQ
jgi:hypothetical protein